jgi:hypothetical protein
MLLAIVCRAEFAQICPNLPKDNYPEKLWNATKTWDFSVFSKIEISMYRRSTRIYVHRLDFQYYNF